MRKTTEETVKRYVYTCDICTGTSNGTAKCRLCSKDLCDKHRVYDPRDYGDYPSTFCKRCWEIGQVYRERIGAIRTRADMEEEALNKEWYDKCKQNKI